MTVRAEILISGRVQGVFYRLQTVEKAKKLGLKGLVRNLNNGQVGIIVEGPKEEIEALIEWCKKGPKLAQVAKIKTNWQKVKSEFSSFEIDR